MFLILLRHNRATPIIVQIAHFHLLALHLQQHRISLRLLHQLPVSHLKHHQDHKITDLQHHSPDLMKLIPPLAVDTQTNKHPLSLLLVIPPHLLQVFKDPINNFQVQHPTHHFPRLLQ